MNQSVSFQAGQIADVVFYLILYSALICTALPVVYIMLWKFLGFWRKHKATFYVAATLLLAGTFTAYYLTRLDWMLWYEAFTPAVQVVGLALFAISFIMIRLSHHHLDLKTILFFSVLNGKHGELMTGGLYGIVRHPIYAFIPLLVAGAFLYTGEFILIVPFAANILLRWYYARLEEKYLHATYGEAYKGYRAVTRNRFYPSFVRVKSK
jgi:protein-S-isoprenylcysteine O-methyltransferase Ste14